uniref:Uncharacterized protein n=2 Tax=gambiae species complex TaxID=44542 RepID=A0A2C9H3R5_ANOGA
MKLFKQVIIFALLALLGVAAAKVGISTTHEPREHVTANVFGECDETDIEVKCVT